MKKHLIFILILTMVMLYTGCSKDNTPEDPSGSQSVAEDNIIDSKGNDIGKESGVFEGDKAKDFYIEDNSGKGIRLDDLAGKVTLLNFWTSWSLHSESMNNLISEF
ncbi:MAG: redoxin domain-containing protein, partial [Clostridiales bacterium]|nr:redoxin domain-containing protein [Clostridiales bacterium]